MIRFDYEAQTIDGIVSSGAIDAADLDDAQQQLRRIGLRATRIAPAADAPGGAVRGAALATFNTQLAQATAAGVPVEQAVRMIADEMPRAGSRRTIAALADELDRGTPLPQAMTRLRGRFPDAYARLLEAGIENHKLPQTLTLLSRHYALVDRLRGQVWSASAYPLVVFLALLIVLSYIGWFVLPQMVAVLNELGDIRGLGTFTDPWQPRTAPYEAPLVTQVVMVVSRWLPAVVLAVIVGVLGVMLVRRVARRRGRSLPILDALALRIPLVGTALRRSLLARFTDALAMGVSSGMDLPAAMRVSAKACAWSPLTRDAETLATTLERGAALSDATGLRVVPAVVPRAIDLASARRSLPETLGVLADSYRHQAEAAAARVPAVLTPLLLLMVVSGVGLAILALLMPIAQTLNAMLRGF
jgi:type II secretory pathway component PulF